jgi:Cys-tRNA(Pro) deacylase
MTIPNTKVTRLLLENKIAFRLLPHDEPVYTVAAAAAQRGVIQEEMVKSILLRDKNRRYVMACVTGETRLDPKAVRTYLGGDWKRLSFASAEEIQQVTGFVQGAVAPLCLPEEVPVIFDEAIARCDRVNISSGDPMAGLELDPQDLIRLAGSLLATIAIPTESSS